MMRLLRSPGDGFVDECVVVDMVESHVKDKEGDTHKGLEFLFVAVKLRKLMR